MLLKFICSAFVAVFILTAGPVMAEQAPRFLSVIEDLPLMFELHEVGEGVQFSSPQGRIAEVTAQGHVKQAAVLAFYESTLPQLGWTQVNRGLFIREDETLELVLEEKGPVLSVRFSLAPTIAKK